MKRALLAAVVIAGATLTGTATAEPATPGVDWQPCQENAEVQCSTVTVPIDHARPSTGTIEVAIARRTATDPSRRVGVLFYMPGGPGGSGVGRLLGGNPLPAEIASRFDVVSYDPRGTNRSHPVRCGADLIPTQPNFVPETGGTLAEVKAFSRRLGDSCREHTGPLVDHVDSASYARDIDMIRAALGERKLSLYGISYGTLSGQMYAENFPHRVRAMVLDSVFDHSLTTREFLLTEARTGEDSFAEFARWCAGTTECVLHGQDVGAVYGALYERAARGELGFPEDPATPMDPLTLATRTNSHFYGPNWAMAAEWLRSLAEQQPVAGLLAEETVPFPVASFCGDHRVRFASEREWQSLWRKQAEVAPTVRAHFAWGPLSLCSDWPGRVGNPQHRTDADDAPPILIMNALHDPATGYEWARSVAQQLDDSVLLTYDGWGHGVVDRTACTVAAATDYLVDRKLPRLGTHCAAEQTATATTTPDGARTARW